MRKLLSTIVLVIIALGVIVSLCGLPVGAEAARRQGRFSEDRVNFGRYYDSRALEQTGAANVVGSVVVTYRGFDTLGEVAVLFIAAIGLAALLYTERQEGASRKVEPASLIVLTGCRFVFPLVLLFGTYIFAHGHLTPGGGFQGGAVVASGFLLIYLGCRGRRLSTGRLSATESLSGLIFVVMGMVGLGIGGSFLVNFLPRGTAYALFSAGVIPIIYMAIGLKVGAELGGIIGNLAGESE